MSKGLSLGTLPGCLPAEEPAEKAPARPAARPLARTVRLIGPDNGWGLSQDRAVLAQAFAAAGWDVLREGAPAGLRVAVNVHLEIPAEHLLPCATHNVLVPNAEWWNPAWSPILGGPGVRVWAKTEHAARVFQGLGARVVRIGFRSQDRRSLAPKVSRQRTFLHVGGASPNKGTRELAAAWRSGWPHLFIVSTVPALGPLPGNVTVRGRLEDAELRALQATCAYHVYPSRYEGYGHAPWEGLSVGAVVLATDGPPFDEHPGAFHLMPSADVGAAPNQLVRFRAPTAEGLAEAVRWALALSAAELAERQAASRATWDQQAAAFSEAIAAAIAALEDAPPVRLSLPPLSSALSDLPPLAYVGRINCVTGYGAAARHQVHLLRRHGLRLQIVDGGSACSPDPDGRDPLVQGARQSDPGAGEPRGTILHIAPNLLRPFLHLPRPHILVSVWETTRLPAEWVPICNEFDQVWCATEWQRGVYRDSGVREELLRVVPFSLDPDLYPAAPAPRAPDGRTVFGSVFQWTERKNPQALLGAYLHAFSAADPVVLRLKSYEGDRPSGGVQHHVAELVRSFRLRGQAPAIEVVTAALSSEDMAAFYAGLDCYVSAHRGEGFGLPIAEALLHGRPVIATKYSAPAEYAQGLYRAVPCTLEPPRGMDWQPFYTAEQLWAHVDVADLAAAMREARAGRLACDVGAVRARFAALSARAGEAAAAALKEVLS